MKFKHLCFLVLGILASCTPKTRVEPSSPLASKEPDYLFSIDDDLVQAEEFLYSLSKNQHLRANKSKFITQEEFDQNFELFLNFKLKVKEAESRGMDQTEEFNSEFSLIKEDLKNPYLIKNSIQEGELRKAYSRMQEAVKASHILVQFPPDAGREDSIAVLRMVESLRRRAEEGEDFNQLAYEYSDDPSAKSNYGSLGYFTALQMVYPFEDAAYNLEIGQISGPIPTDFGYHIIKLEDKRPNPGEIRVSHILIRVNPANPVSEDRAKRRIVDIYAELNDGNHDWEEVVLTYSEDEGTKKSGGMLPWFGVGAIVPEFEEIAFSLTERNEISPPVRTPFGYHIVKLEDTKPLAAYEDIEPMLKSKILRDSRSQLIQSQVLAMQKAKFGFKENESLADTLKLLFDNYTKDRIHVLADSLLGSSLSDSALMVIRDERYTVSTFVGYLKDDLALVNTGSGGYFNQLYDKFQQYALDQVEEFELLHNNKEYSRLVQEYRDGILLFSLMNDLVWQKALLDSTSQLEYYNSHLDRYQWSGRVPGLIVKMDDDSQLAKVRRFLRDKVYQKTLKPRLEDQFLNDYPMLFTLEEGIFVLEGHPILSEIDVEDKNTELVYAGHQYFILLGEVIPAGPKSFDETRGQVIQDYQKDLDLELIKDLKEKHIIQIDEVEKERVSQMVVKK